MRKKKDLELSVPVVEQQEIRIPKPDLALATITLIGDSPLLVNKFSEKAKNEINEKHQKKAKTAKLARDPESEYKASLYIMPDGKSYGMPTSGIKLAAVSACRFVDGLKMTQAKGAFHVIDEGCGLTRIDDPKTGKPAKPVLDARFVRIGPFGKKVPMERYRGRFDQWAVTFRIRYSKNNISAEQIANLFETAGFSVGLCEYRPEKSGSLGMFHVSRGT